MDEKHVNQYGENPDNDEFDWYPEQYDEVLFPEIHMDESYPDDFEDDITEFSNIIAPLNGLGTLYGSIREEGIIAVGRREEPENEYSHIQSYTVFTESNWSEQYRDIFWCQDDNTKYVCPNTLTRDALYGHSPEYVLNRLLKDGETLFYEFNDKFVFELNAISVRLDVSQSKHPYVRDKSTFCYCYVLHLVNEGKIPLPSIIVFAGSDLHLIWLLREEGNLIPPLRTPKTEQQYKRIAEELVSRTWNLKSDFRATRLTNWIKAPGIIDSRTGQDVNYLTTSDPTPRYTLGELMNMLSLNTSKTNQKTPIGFSNS